ncbi:cytochrome P450 [Ascidiaceihabitans sp.]|uniref:cytochrome P450 n=1 Tax=Ascidiaceihabitans sp. TaxID=1872644 RepID=UPI003299BC96
MTRSLNKLPTLTFSDPQDVDRILRGKDFSIFALQGYLEQIEAASGHDLSAVRRFAQHSLIYQSDDTHLQSRRLIAAVFSEKALDAWVPMMDAAIAVRLDALAQVQDADLMRDFVDPLFCDVILPIIGFDPHPKGQAEMLNAVADLRKFTEKFLSLRELRKMNAWLNDTGLVAPNMDTQADGPATLSSHVAAALGDVPDKENMVRDTGLSLFVAAHSAGLGLGFAAWGLLMHGQGEWQDAGQRDWPDRKLEQVLSVYLSTRFVGRVSDADGDVGGCPVHHNQHISLDMQASNLALRKDWLSQDRPNGVRSPTQAFGAGRHKCPGEAFARLFILRALPALSRRFPDMILHKDRCSFLVSPMLQGPRALPCTPVPLCEKPAAKLWNVKDHTTARAIITDDKGFAPPQMEAHLQALHDKSGRDLSPVIHIAKNAMFFMSGPRHAAARKSVMQVLGQNRLRVWHGLIDDRIQVALDALQASGAPDLVEDFANPVFRAITKPILGLHPSDLDRFDTLAPVLQDVLEPLLPMRQILQLQEVFAETMSLVSTGRARTEDAPSGAVSLQDHLQQNPPEGYDDADIAALVLVLYGASFNLSHTLGNALHWVLSLPWDLRQDVADPAWTNTRIEEIMSTCGSPKFIYRHARNTQQVDGLAFNAKDTACIHLNAVNRGKTTGHLSFGHGLHHCVGASLSRLLLRRAIPAVFARFPNIRLTSQGHRYFDMSQTVAMQSLKCDL